MTTEDSDFLIAGGATMRSTEKFVAILVLALVAWAVLMALATSFQGSQSNRILLVELGTDAVSLNQAVQIRRHQVTATAWPITSRW